MSFFFKEILFVKTFFLEIFKLIKNSVNNLGFLSLPYNFNNKLLSSSSRQFYNYLVIFFNLKNFYNFFLINVNLNYFYLHITHDAVYSLVNFFKKNLILTLKGLYDIFVIDYPSRLLRFELIYGFTSVYNGVRVFLKTHVSENISMCSISNVFSSANWLERECWDLFGVFFANHKNLRRILTDYGFRGFPFRKDFPLTGYIEVRFDDSLFSIVYEPLEISQEFRVFNFRSPWENYEL
jgi:NADH-quinone oxidoreductase subunit C